MQAFRQLLPEVAKEREGYTMQKQTLKFAVESRNGVVVSVGHSTIMQPVTNFKGGSIKWFDDTKLLKSNKAKENQL